MLLKGNNGNEVELSLVGEALPETQDGFGDDSWCTLIVRAATGDDEWEETSPCMNTFAIRNLVEWLEAVGGAEDASGSPEEAEVELLEPELRFTVTQQGEKNVGIRVWFHLADRPEEFGVDAQTDASYVDVYLDRESVLAAGGSLRAALDAVEGGERGTRGKDDLRGEATPGMMGLPDDDLNLVDGISKEPPGAGTGEDNAGNR